ncbi:hypothetical protein ACH4YO_41445 [Streptomyces noursei]|uniref:hypothetical protein n=1 Tax=Streptomyces noursei TaxID=1971 RepID=UPI0033FA3ED0
MEWYCIICTAAPTSSDDTSICLECQRRLRGALTRFPRLYVQLYVELPFVPRSSPLQQPPNRTPWKSREKGTPLRLPLLDHAQRCTDVLRAWATYAMPDIVPEETVRPGHLFQELCHALAADLPMAVKSTEGGRHAHRTWMAYTIARRLLGQTEPARPMATPCLNCDMRALLLIDNYMVICRSCRAHWSIQTWHAATSPRHIG